MLLLAQLFRVSGRRLSAGSWVSLWCPTPPRCLPHVSAAGRPAGTAPGRPRGARRRSVAQRPAMARPYRRKRRQRLGAVGKEREPGLRLPLEHHRAALDLVIPPVWGDVQRLGELWHRQGPCDAARVRLRAMLHEAQLEADALDGAGQDRGPTGRAIAVLGQLPGHLVVALARGKQHPNLLRHLVRRGQVREGPDRDQDLKGGGLAAMPDNAGVNLIAPGPLDHYLVNETAQ